MPKIEPPSPDAQRLLGLIVRQIASGRIRANLPETFLAFSEALSLLGEDSPSVMAGARLSSRGLADLHAWIEAHAELPKVTGLIVNKDTRRPHEDFPKWHGHANDPEWEKWWLEEANRAIAYDWRPFIAPEFYATELPPAPTVREDGEPAAPDFHGIITKEPGTQDGRAFIRGMRITVGDILRWLAAGKSEQQILDAHPELTQEDIRASLAYAADREQQSAKAETEPSRLSTLASKWRGKFDLPQSDDDPRMDYLLRKYWRNRE